MTWNWKDWELDQIFFENLCLLPQWCRFEFDENINQSKRYAWKVSIGRILIAEYRYHWDTQEVHLSKMDLPDEPLLKSAFDYVQPCLDNIRDNIQRIIDAE